MIKPIIEPALIEAPHANQPPTKILLVEDNPGDVRLVKETLAGQYIANFEVAPAASLGQALIRLSGEQFDVILLDLSLPDAQGLETLGRVQSRAPSIPIVVMTGLSDESMAMRAVNEGAQDYLIKGEVDGNALARRLCFAIERSRGSSARSSDEAQPKPCKTLGILGSKGGVGASTLACYLGMALQSRVKEPVLLADFDSESGILGFLMEAEPKYSIADALQNVGRMDLNLWVSLVCNKTPGLDIIAAPIELVPDEAPTAEELRKLFSFLRGSYRWIIADLGSGFNKNLTRLLEDVDVTYVVTTLELAALRQARLTIQRLRRLGCHADSIRPVVNELPKRSPFSPPNLEEMLGSPVWATIPHVPELRENHERSTSLPRTASMEMAINRMVELIAGIPEPKPKRRWPF
jgi:Flp pilus assembly CpaE family ATPase